MTDEQAVQELADRTSAYSDPIIPASRLLTILQERARVRAFAANSAYRLGEIVLATGADLAQPGTAYICVQAGIGGSLSPTWPLDGKTWASSGQAAFRLYGPYDGKPYNISAAARQVYKEKASEAARRMDYANGPDKVFLGQQYEHFLVLMNACGPEWPL